MTFREACEQGWNEVSIDHEFETAFVVTLSHRATPDNAVTLLLPRDTPMVFWADHFGGDLEEAVRVLITEGGP